MGEMESTGVGTRNQLMEDSETISNIWMSNIIFEFSSLSPTGQIEELQKVLQDVL